MYKLILALTLLSWVVPTKDAKKFFTDVSVAAYGATGNGTTDDTNAINAAFAAANSSHVGVFFPAGTYLCNTVDGNGHILLFQPQGSSGISLYGSGAKITTTSVASTLLYIYAGSGVNNLTIHDIFFESTHATTTTNTTGVFIAGTSGQNADNMVVQFCRFEGFNNDLGGQGIDGWLITRNQFYAPKGHDNGEQNTNPNVAIAPSANGSGYVDNITVTYNIGIGFTGTSMSGLSYKGAQDGLYRGVAWNATIMYNRTSFYGQEHYAVQPFPTGLSPDPLTHTGVLNHTYIGHNQLDCAIYPGSIDGSTIHSVNYGIRVDQSNCTVDDNYIYTYTVGIMSRPVDYTSTSFDSIAFTNNKLIEASDQVNYTVSGAFVTSGTITHLTVTGNQVQTRFVNPTSFSGSQPTTLINNLYAPFNCNCFF